MKLFNMKLVIGFIASSISLTVSAQQWKDSGTDIVNTNSGSVMIRKDYINGALPPSWGHWTLYSFGSTSHTTGVATKVIGGVMLSLNQSTGTLTESLGIVATAGNETSGQGLVTKGYGVRARVQAGKGSVTTGYGVYIDNTESTNDYGIYQAGTDDDNYFAGNIGIGTTDPKGYKLAVAGKAIAEEVVVKLQANWPDYVFEKNYNLPTLAELEAYIKVNKHLPEVPSACTVEDNGVKLGEMNMLLLKKVEELTLYVIEQEKKIDALKKLIETEKKE